MPAPLFVVVGAIPDTDYDIGQVIGQGRINSRHLSLHLSLRLIRPLHRGANLAPCDKCGAMLADAGYLADHVAKRHWEKPAPPKPAAKAAPITDPAPVNAAAEQEVPLEQL